MNFFYFLSLLFGAQSFRGEGSTGSEPKVVEFTSEVEEDDDVPPSGPTAPPSPAPDLNEITDVPTQDGDDSEGGETTPILADGTVEVVAGRVATLQPSGDDISGLRIVQGTDHGTVTVNPDGTFALVMTQSDFTGTQSFTYEADHSDGTTTRHEITLDVVEGPQEAGWATGTETYMLETDADGRIVVEHGDVHGKVYISGSSDALSLSDVALLEGVSVNDIDGAFLLAKGYGSSELTALDETAGTKLWLHMTPAGSETSNWLLFERGYTYEGQGINGVFSAGESEMHPVYVGAWGEGDLPELTYEFKIKNADTSNVVLQDLHFSGGLSLYQSTNVIADGIEVSGQDNYVSIEGTGHTLMNSYIHDTSSLAGHNMSGAYFGGTTGILVDGNFFHHNGWTADGVDPIDNMSHNLYIDAGNWDITVRDNITMQASAFGAHIRPGGLIEDNVFLDNNAAVDSLGGDFYGYGDIGHYALYSGNVITSAGYRDGAGYKSLGLYDTGNMTTLVDNIIAHMADPNNPEELADKPFSDVGFLVVDPYYNDTVVWNWASYSWRYDLDYTNDNTEGLDTDILDATTIQNFLASTFNQSSATIDDLAAFIASEWAGALPDGLTADDIVAYFQSGFGISDDGERSTETTLRFVPNDIGDGVRWDNRLNWDTNDLPGTAAGDDVDLGGNHVVFGTNAEIDEMAMSSGSLDIFGGRLDISGGITDGGNLDIGGSGQAWIGGHSGPDTLDIDVSGGRFANTGQMGETDLDVTGGQAILATGGAEYDVDAGRTLAIFDAAAKVGFDGDDDGIAILDLHEGGTLAYSATSGDLGTIEEFRSGAFGDAPSVKSGIDLGGAALEIDLVGLSAEAGTEFTLMDADELVGVFNDASIGGLGGRDATIVIDYLTDSVTLKLTAGTGQVNVETVGEQTDVTAGEEDIWAALTADQGLAEDQALPAEEELLEVA